MPDTLLVTGASGQLGRKVIGHLLQTHQIAPGNMIAVTRKPEALADLAALGVVVRPGDFDDPASLVSAFKGAQRMEIISTDAFYTPGQRVVQHKNAIDAAVKAGVEHIVYTSMPRPEPGCPIVFAPDHFLTEQTLIASPLNWTILRHCWYSENLQRTLGGALTTGRWYTASGEGTIAHVPKDDCARTDAAALASGFNGRRVLDVTGTKALTHAEIAALVSEVLGKPIEVIQVTAEQLTQGLTAAGVPAGFVPLMVGSDLNTRGGGFSTVSDTVFQLTGKAPLSLRAFLEANKALFAA